MMTSLPLKTDLASLQQHGFVLLRGAIDRAAVVALRRQVMDVVCDEGWALDRQGRAAPEARLIGSAAFIELTTRLQALETAHSLWEHSSLSAWVEAALGRPGFVHPRKMVRVAWPDHLAPHNRIVPHQDHAYVKGEVDTLTTWVPLGDYPPENGGLEVLPGSHDQGRRPSAPDAAGRYGCGIVAVPPAERFWRASYRMGDAVVFHSLTVHQGGHNRSDLLRLSLDFRWSDLWGRIDPDQCLPAYAPQVPGWSKLTQGWVRPERIALPQTVTVEGSNGPPATVHNIRALEEAHL